MILNLETFPPLDWAHLLPQDRGKLDFQCHRFEVNPHSVAEVMSVLLKGGQSASQEEAVKEMKDYRSMKHHCVDRQWCQNMGWEYFMTAVAQKQPQVTRISLDDQKPNLCYLENRIKNLEMSLLITLSLEVFSLTLLTFKVTFYHKKPPKKKNDRLNRLKTIFFQKIII